MRSFILICLEACFDEFSQSLYELLRNFWTTTVAQMKGDSNMCLQKDITTLENWLMAGGHGKQYAAVAPNVRLPSDVRFTRLAASVLR